MAGPQSGVRGSYTPSDALLGALREAGVTHLFVNFGSDHPRLVECLAKGRALGSPIPRIITCPNEMVALSAAHGFLRSGNRTPPSRHRSCRVRYSSPRRGDT